MFKRFELSEAVGRLEQLELAAVFRLSDWNGAKRLNGWNDWNGLRLRERVHFNAGNRGRHRQERALVMELLHRHSGLKQRMIAERLEILDEGLVSGYDRKAIRDKIETEPKM